MKYILDSSAAMPWVLPERNSAKAIQLRDDARNALGADNQVAGASRHAVLRRVPGNIPSFASRPATMIDPKKNHGTNIWPV